MTQHFRASASTLHVAREGEGGEGGREGGERECLHSICETGVPAGHGQSMRHPTCSRLHDKTKALRHSNGGDQRRGAPEDVVQGRGLGRLWGVEAFLEGSGMGQNSALRCAILRSYCLFKGKKKEYC